MALSFQPGVTALDIALCALMAGAGYAWGRSLRMGLGAASLVFMSLLSAGLLLALILGNLGDGAAPLAVGVLAHLAGSCAALFGAGRDD